jgi:hypothetical protein
VVYSADLAIPFCKEGPEMTIPEAKPYVGRNCTVTWKDRRGIEQSTRLHIENLTFVPLYGAYLVGDIEDVCLDKVTRIQPLD